VSLFSKLCGLFWATLLVKVPEWTSVSCESQLFRGHGTRPFPPHWLGESSCEVWQESSRAELCPGLWPVELASLCAKVCVGG
jgi:hypothetical protein